MNSLHPPWKAIATQIHRFRLTGALDITEVDQAVSMLGNFVWELGPYLDTDQLGFALSPGWDRPLLHQAEHIINTAPRINDVVFLPAKPPKKWNGIFKLDTGDGLIDVHASRIGFDLQEFGSDDLEIKIVLDPSLESWKGDVVNIWIDSEIGEYNKIIHISWCEINFGGASESQPFALRRRFFERFPNAPYATEALRLASGKCI